MTVYTNHQKLLYSVEAFYYYKHTLTPKLYNVCYTLYRETVPGVTDWAVWAGCEAEGGLCVAL